MQGARLTLFTERALPAAVPVTWAKVNTYAREN